MQEVVGARFQTFDQPGSMGVVTDTRYVRCFWPKLDRPTPLFAAGSSGIEVEGPPTPRNVVFPPDTKFLDRKPADGGASLPTRRDCFFLRERVPVRELPGGKTIYDEYVAELTVKEADDLMKGRVSEDSLRVAKEFVGIEDRRPMVRAR